MTFSKNEVVTFSLNGDTLLTQLELPFSKPELVQYLSEYARKGYPAVHHSQIYAKLYHPHYRVIDFKYLSEVPVEKVL